MAPDLIETTNHGMTKRHLADTVNVRVEDCGLSVSE